MRSLVLGVLGLGTVVLAGRSARAESNNDFLSPREVALGEAVRGNATGQAGVDVNPSGLGLNRELAFEGGYGHRSSDSASLISVSACDSTTAIPGCFFYHYAGVSPDTVQNIDVHSSTHVGGIALGRVLAPRLSIGSTVKYFHFATDVPTQRDASGWAFDFGATVRLTESVSLGASAENMFTTTDTPEFPRTVGGGVYARPFSLFAVSFDVRWRLDGDQQAARYGGGAELFLPFSNGQAGVPIRAGALHDNSLGGTFLSAGLGYSMTSWSIDVAGRHEISGGKDNMIIASLRLFGPRLPAPGLQ
ncbi:MAG TPA: hypothetical protein VFP84_27585 [Kofleriaceae bacterium]|nr:hypothetical protein [Kofleriaceae bacterium]